MSKVLATSDYGKGFRIGTMCYNTEKQIIEKKEKKF